MICNIPPNPYVDEWYQMEEMCVYAASPYMSLPHLEKYYDPSSSMEVVHESNVLTPFHQVHSMGTSE